jgi:Holliday junction resolvasome RuvABC endonuclease subunit
MIALGLDLSLTGTGWAVVDTDRRTTRVGTISTVPGPPEPRLTYILDEIPTAGVALAAVEAFLPGVTGGKSVERGALHLMTRIKLWRAGIPFALVHVSRVKKYATGAGGANKTQIQDALIRRLGLDECPRFADDNQADAFVLALMAADRLGEPLVAMPASHREVMGKVEWPDLLSDDLAAVGS